MIRPLPERFIEDRRLRDAARAVLADDVSRVRDSLTEKGIASRVSSGVTTTISARVRAGANDVLAQARAQASDHKGVVALLIGAIILWFARSPIIAWFDSLDADADSDLAETTADPPAPAAPPASASDGDPA